LREEQPIDERVDLAFLCVGAWHVPRVLEGLFPDTDDATCEVCGRVIE
jgi:hypothetical protein